MKQFLSIFLLCLLSYSLYAATDPVVISSASQTGHNDIANTEAADEPQLSYAYYIDPVLGSDSNSGTEAAPLQTVEAARDLIRLFASSMAEDIIVYLRAGSYPTLQSIDFDSSDSGQNGHRVIYRNYPNEAPVIEAGIEITGWTSVGGGIYAASAQGMDFLQLYVNNKMAQRARYPEVGQEFNLKQTFAGSMTLAINQNEIQNWSDLNRVEMVVASSFTSCRLRIASFRERTEQNDILVTPMEPERTNYWNWLEGPLQGTPSYFYENHLTFLDQPGEWFLDIDNDTVYYMPRAGEDLSLMNVYVPQTERILNMDSVENMTLFGLTFQHAAWHDPASEGMIQRQAGMYVTESSQYTVVPSALYFDQIKNVRIERCIFRNMGGNGLNFKSTQNNTIVGNVFADIADTAISYDVANNRNATGENVSLNDLFDSNYFFRMGRIYYGGAGIFAFWPEDMQITHNEIAYCNGFAVNVGWGADESETAFKRPYIAFNRIHDVAVLTRDSGGIHTKSNASGGIITENWIYNTYNKEWWDIGPERHTHGVYLDDESEDYAVTDNVFMMIKDDNVYERHNSDNITNTNNNGQNQDVKDNSGIRSGYLDIKGFWQGGAIGRDLEPEELYTGSNTPLETIYFDDFIDDTLGETPAGYMVDQTGGTVTVSGVGPDQSLRLTDTDSGDGGPSAQQSFIPQAGTVAIEYRIRAGQASNGHYIELLDDEGVAACQIGFSESGTLRYYYQPTIFADIQSYASQTWHTIRIEADVERQQYSLWIDGELALADSLFLNSTGPLESFNLKNTSARGYVDIDTVEVEGEISADSATSQGTPYSWFSQYFDSNTWLPVDYELFDAADQDSDGFTSSQEYLTGTLPDDATSYFEITPTVSNRLFSCSWDTLTGRLYTLQFSTSLEADSWTDIDDPAYIDAPGTGSPMVYSETSSNSEKRFYRIKVSGAE